VRELKNAVERSVYRVEDAAKPVERILFDPFASPYTPEPKPEENGSAPPAIDSRKLSLPLPSDFRAAIHAYEHDILSLALERAQFKQTIAADLLGLSYHQFRGLLKKHSLPERQGPSRPEA
jgi:psp operon transcriptional activator